MAQKQDPPKKTMKDLLKKISKSGDRASASQSYQSMARGAVSAILPKTSALKSALAKGDKSSASSSFTARAAKKVAMGAGKALKSIAAKKDSTSNPILNRINSIMGAKKGKPNTVKIDSTKKVTPIGGSKPSVMIKKETKIKDVKPITKEFRKKMQAWDKLPKVEYKPLPKK
jgi:hypothetical protein